MWILKSAVYRNRSLANLSLLSFIESFRHIAESMQENFTMRSMPKGFLCA